MISKKVKEKAIFGFIYCFKLDNMPHQHHQGCGHENNDHDHDHDHDSSELGFQDNLFTHIDRGNVIGLNTGGTASDVIKPWHERFDETKVKYLMFEMTISFSKTLTSSFWSQTPTIKCALLFLVELSSDLGVIQDHPHSIHWFCTP